MASSSGSARKRTHLVLPLESKIAILEQLKAGATQAQLAEENRIGSSTVGNIKKNEAKLRSFTSTMDNTAMNKKGRRVMRLTDNDNPR